MRGYGGGYRGVVRGGGCRPPGPYMYIYIYIRCIYICVCTIVWFLFRRKMEKGTLGC